MSETVTMYQIYDPRDRSYVSFSNSGPSITWPWVKDKKRAHNFETLRELYNQLLQIPYHGVDAEDDPVNYCKIVKVQVSGLMHSLTSAMNDLKAVGAIKTETLNLKQEIDTAFALDDNIKNIFNTVAFMYTGTASLEMKRNNFADTIRKHIPDISEEEVNHYVHKHLPERKT